MNERALPVEPERAHLLRLDTAVTLKRFAHIERALATIAAAWVPGVRRLESKAALARSCWHSATTARSLRERVFELRYPDRSLDVGDARSQLHVIESAVDAPGGAAAMHALASVLLPAIRKTFQSYIEASDDVADGPTLSFMGPAVAAKLADESALTEATEAEMTSTEEELAREWAGALRRELEAVGDVGLDAPADAGPELAIPGGRTYEMPQVPARDERYFVSSFYWPDNFDPSWPYGEGLQLQLRSAISHLNEVWAVETAAVILQQLEPRLGWDFLFDAARWLYDESRHMTMGKRRLEWWGFQPGEVPLGSYIYEACRDQDSIHRLAMLSFFETKNIGKKRTRSAELGQLGDVTSQRDMDFDWADEAIHAGYGRKWLREAMRMSGQDPEAWPEVVARCEALVAERVAGATKREKDAVTALARALIERAHSVASSG